MALTLRKAKGNRPTPPDWDDDDYDVKWDGQVVGRIYRRAGVSDHQQPWFWSILAFAPRIRTSGLAVSLEDAKAQFAKNWRTALQQ